jgi:hypothetical protein
MKKLWFLLLALAVPAAAECVPHKVLKIVTVFDREGEEPATLYRLGDRYGRLETRASLFVVNEPDLWVVTDDVQTGQHSVDTGTPKFHAPILDAMDSKFWRQFEFGCEEPFMKAVNARAEPLDGGVTRYTHEVEGVSVVLTVAKGKPQRVEVTTPKGSYAIRYLEFEMLDETSTDRFKKPEGIRFEETKPEQ